MVEGYRLPPPRPARGRLYVVAALVATVALGLASRRWPLPGLLAEHAGDALYTVAVFWSLALIAPAMVGPRIGGLAFLASAAVEFAQLLQWPWLLELRQNRLAALVLGQGFQWVDLAAYAVGAMLAIGFDALLLFSRRFRRWPSRARL